MRRLAVFVFVPFVLLAAVAFWLTSRSDEAKPPEIATAPEPARVVPERHAPRLPSMPARAPLAERAVQPHPLVRSSLEPLPLPAADPYTQPEPPLVDTAPARGAEPKVALQDATTADKEDIRAALQAVVPLVRQCFADAEKRYRGEQSVTLSFTVKGQGLTGYLDEGEVASSSIQDPWLQQCFLEAISEARFPPPRNGGVFRITHAFRYVPDAGQ